MITVEKLIKLLQKQDKGRVVILASDGEGNSFSPADNDILECLWDNENREIGDEQDEPDFEGEKALVIFPI
jgi:hypothetical protein